MAPTSPRLRYERLTPENAATFHALAIDPHVRRYLLDGEIVSAEWAAAEVARSDALFAEHGAGLWLVADTAPVGFAGYRVFEELGPEPQLLYAFREEATGRGYATEVGRALIEDVARPIVSAVDAPNAASIRVLEKLGFERTGAVPGAFGEIILFRLG